MTKYHITKSQYPTTTECGCGNQLVGRPDGTQAFRVQRIVARSKRWPTIGYFCADCVNDYR